MTKNESVWSVKNSRKNQLELERDYAQVCYCDVQYDISDLPQAMYVERYYLCSAKLMLIVQRRWKCFVTFTNQYMPSSRLYQTTCHVFLFFRLVQQLFYGSVQSSVACKYIVESQLLHVLSSELDKLGASVPQSFSRSKVS